MKSTTRKKSPGLLPIYLTVFIDMLGIGIIIPVIPAIFFEAGSSFFEAGYSMDNRSIIYGFLLASFPFMQFFGAPILGALSDKFGRRPLITTTLFGTMLGYLLFAIALKIGNLPLLFVSRMIPGFLGGNISIIYSAISDISKDEERTRNFGLVGMTFGIGFILGPTIGGILADETVVSWFNYATPFWFTAILTGLNLIFVYFAFNETLQEKRSTKINVLTGFRNIATSFKSPDLRPIFTVVLTLSLGFTFFTQFFSVLLIQDFGYTEKNIGILYGWVGIFLAFTQGGLVPFLTKFAPRKVLSISMLVLSISLACLLLPSNPNWFFLINAIIAIGHGTNIPFITTIVSKKAGPERQGEIMGINQSMNSLGQMIPAVIAGYLTTINGKLPIMTSAALIFIGWLLFLIFFRFRNNS